MVKQTRRVSRRKSRGGAPRRILFNVTWKADGVQQQDMLKFLIDKKLPKEAEGDYPLKEIHSFADLVDEIELHLENENLGYEFVKVPLRSNRGGEPIALHVIGASWRKSGDPPVIGEFTAEIIPKSGAKILASATFTERLKDPKDLLPLILGGKTRKSRGRRRA